MVLVFFVVNLLRIDLYDVVKEITREIIKSAIESTKNCGVIPNEVQSILE